MSDTDGTCEYVLDPDDPETWGGEEGDECYVDEEVLNEDGVWTCPHRARGESHLCLFHTPVDEKRDEEVATAFLNVLNNVSNSDRSADQIRKLQFLGAKFGEFNLSGQSPEIDIGYGYLSMRYVQIRGSLDWSDLFLDIPEVRLQEVKFKGSADFVDSEFGGEVYFDNAEFGGQANFTKTKFRDKVSFHRVSFGNHAIFELTKFQSKSNFDLARFSSRISFERAKFKNRANFYAGEFIGTAMFRRTIFRAYVNLGSVEFRDDVSFEGATFEEESFFMHAEFWGTALFNEGEKAEFEGTADFRSAEFNEDANFSGLNLDASQFDKADLTDASFAGSSLRKTSFESALLSRATLFNADLRGTRINGAVLGDIRINEGTQFLGNPSDDSDSSPHTLSAIRSRPKCVYDPNYEENDEHEDVDKAKSVYRALEELGGKHARPRLQARSFVRRQDLQKKDYWDDTTADDASLEERFIAGARWSRARVARATLLYGESPWRVITWSLGIILSFALLYPLGGWMKPADGDPITYAQIASNPVEILNSVYYSTLTYTALGFGDFQPVGFGRVLTTLETGLGAVMLALLVFILGRRAAR